MSEPDDIRTGTDGVHVGETSALLTRLTTPRSEESLVVKIGGIIMVVAALMSWLEPGLSTRPSLVGAGPVTGGVGLVVLASGLSFLFRPTRPGFVLGRALGGFVAVLIFLVRIKTIPENGPELATGAWIALTGAAIALFGSVLLVPGSDFSPGQGIEWPAALVGATMAVVGPLFLAWGGLIQGSSLQLDFRPFEILADGLSTELITGYPILILGSAVLLSASLARVKGGKSGGRRGILIACQASGSAIALLAGMEVAATLMQGNATNSSGRFLILSGPLASLAGGILLAYSVRHNEAADTAPFPVVQGSAARVRLKQMPADGGP